MASTIHHGGAGEAAVRVVVEIDAIAEQLGYNTQRQRSA
jgi:hypothetical protein